MLFKHPELLYGLFLLVIPVLVHLFQLRRFKKQSFTNVKFLKKAVQQTRKSSRIKKWLILLLRLLLFTSLIIAFAQPYIPSSEAVSTSRETVIYLDNSYSMEAKGADGSLLRRSIQDLLEMLPREEKVTLFTNNTEYRDAEYEYLRQELQDLPYSPLQLEWKTVAGKAANFFSNDPASEKVFIGISDFQTDGETAEIELEDYMTSYLVKLEPQVRSNVFIDSVYVSEQGLDEMVLSVKISSVEENQEIPISLYNGTDLLAKRMVVLEQENSALVDFPLPSQVLEKGRIEIEDEGLQFDNSFYFSINKIDAIEVVVIGDAEVSFLERIYKEPEFHFNSYSPRQVDISSLDEADLVILNEPDEISLPLGSSLEQLVQEGVFLAIIPSVEGQVHNYNSLLRAVGLPQFQELITQEKLITEIVYNHPLYRSVFEEQVENFQYPEVKSYFKLTRRGEKVLGFENQEEFLLRSRNTFLFTAALNAENSNFQNAPLIVPTFYNLGNLALSPPKTFYTLGELNRIDISIGLDRDEILNVRSEASSFIPLQQSFPNKVLLEMEEAPDQAGHYEVLRDSVKLSMLSFNISRLESLLNYQALEGLEGIEVENSIPAVFEAVESKNEINALWKWFVIFALFFLLTEMFILKFLK